MNITEYSKSLTELQEQLKAANDELAAAETDEAKAAAVEKASGINAKIDELKDTFIQEQNAAYEKAQQDLAKSESERQQALKLVSDNANKGKPQEKDPRKIFTLGVGGN